MSAERKRRIARGTAWAARRLEPENTPPVRAGDLGECPTCDGDGYYDRVGEKEVELVVCGRCRGEGLLEIQDGATEPGADAEWTEVVTEGSHDGVTWVALGSEDLPGDYRYTRGRKRP